MVRVFSSPAVGKVVVGRGALSMVGGEVERLKPHKVAVVTTEDVAKLWLDEVLRQLGREAEVFILEDGESVKRLEVAERLLRSLLRSGFTRKSMLLGLGGGALCDVVGFAASIYMRGMMLFMVPTTLLAQVDAAIGGKTGVNLEGKNVVGTFYPANVTVVDTDLLRTLPKEDLINGMAEVVKYGVAVDSSIFRLVEEAGGRVLEDLWLLDEVVARCVEAKVKVVNEDPKEESGVRMKLNFGHTIGHAVEALARTRHGHAVSMGMVCECMVAEHVTGFKETRRVVDVLKKLGLPTELSVDPGEVVKLIKLDKKAWYGRPILTLPVKLGSAAVREVDEELLLKILEGPS